jgi:hypothetical protein
MRRAIVTGGLSVNLDLVKRYLPSNYQATEGPDGIVIEGSDNAGWTLDGYVIPRLASGLIAAEEVPVELAARDTVELSESDTLTALEVARLVLLRLGPGHLADLADNMDVHWGELTRLGKRLDAYMQDDDDTGKSQDSP